MQLTNRMKVHMLRAIRRQEKGFTLIEILVGLAITGALVGVVAMAVPLMNSSVKRGNNHTYVATQLQNATHWIQVDAKMAQEVTPDGGGSGFPLTLTWVDWDNTEYQSVYDVSGGDFSRAHTVTVVGNDPVTTTRSLAQSIASGTCSYADGMLTIQLTSEEGSGREKASQVRTIEVKPRTQ
ncbi:MAG: prepilin-type N-terminal cleavage/methylation domain-containing protein [Chloroflexi bacterium]|nr:prepilin-type N-terminal cleavage/methylation domain-containing protein [Chloroflexota bacterium]